MRNSSFGTFSSGEITFFSISLFIGTIYRRMVRYYLNSVMCVFNMTIFIRIYLGNLKCIYLFFQKQQFLYICRWNIKFIGQYQPAFYDFHCLTLVSIFLYFVRFQSSFQLFTLFHPFIGFFYQLDDITLVLFSTISRQLLYFSVQPIPTSAL